MLPRTFERVQNFNLYRVFGVINIGNNNDGLYLRVIDYYNNFVEGNIDSGVRTINR